MKELSSLRKPSNLLIGLKGASLPKIRFRRMSSSGVDFFPVLAGDRMVLSPIDQYFLKVPPKTVCSVPAGLTLAKTRR